MSSEKKRKLKPFRMDGLEPPGLMIRILRYANGWTAKDLIEKMEESGMESAEIAESRISEYENGTTFPSKPVIKKLCYAFKVSPSFLFISQKTHPETIRYLVKPITK